MAKTPDRSSDRAAVTTFKAAETAPDYVMFRINRNGDLIRKDIEESALKPSLLLVEPSKVDRSFRQWAQDQRITLVAYQNAQTQDISVNRLRREAPYAFYDKNGNAHEDPNWPGEYSGDPLTSPTLKEALLQRLAHGQSAAGAAALQRKYQDQSLESVLQEEPRAHSSLKSLLSNPQFRAESIARSELAQHLIAEGKKRIDEGYQGMSLDNVGRWLNTAGNTAQYEKFVEKYGGDPARDIAMLMRVVDQQLDAHYQKRSGQPSADFKLLAQNFEEGFLQYTDLLKRQMPDGSVRNVVSLVKEELWFTGDGAEDGIEKNRVSPHGSGDREIVGGVLKRGFDVFTSEYTDRADQQRQALAGAAQLINDSRVPGAGKFGISFGEESQQERISLHPSVVPLARNDAFSPRATQFAISPQTSPRPTAVAAATPQPQPPAAAPEPSGNVRDYLLNRTAQARANISREREARAQARAAVAESAATQPTTAKEVPAPQSATAPIVAPPPAVPAPVAEAEAAPLAPPPMAYFATSPITPSTVEPTAQVAAAANDGAAPVPEASLKPVAPIATTSVAAAPPAAQPPAAPPKGIAAAAPAAKPQPPAVVVQPAAPDPKVEAARKVLAQDLDAIRKAVTGLNDGRKGNDAKHLKTIDGFVKRSLTANETEFAPEDGKAGLSKSPQKGDYLRKQESRDLQNVVKQNNAEIKERLKDGTSLQEIEEIRKKMAKELDDTLANDKGIKHSKKAARGNER